MFGLQRKDNLSEVEALKQQNKKLNARLEAVAEVNKSLVGVVDTQKVFNLITHKLAPSVKMNFSSIWLYDDRRQAIYLASHSIPDAIKFVAEAAIGKKIEELAFYRKNPDEVNSTYFKVIDGGKPIYSKDLYAHTRPFLNEKAAKLLEVASGMQLAVSVPIVVDNKPIGVLSAIWKEAALSKEDDITLFAFANQISTAIYNAQLFSEKQQQLIAIETQNHDLASLFNLSSQISKSLDPQKVAQIAVDALPQNAMMSGGMILDFDEKTRTTGVVAATSNRIAEQVTKVLGDFGKFRAEIDAEPAQSSPIVQAIKKKEISSSTNMEAIMFPVPPKLANIAAKIISVKSVVAYPITSRNKVTGVVAYFLKDHTYDELEQSKKQLLTTYTLQINIAIENAALYKESQQIRENLQDALYQLQEARRVERDMIDVMGHELRTPISIVRNALVMLEKQTKSTDTAIRTDLHKYLDMALESTRREITLIETLLSATKVDAARMQLIFTKVDMQDVIEDSIEGQKDQVAKKQLQIEYTPPNSDTLVYADRTRIQEILDNLYSNAVKYTPQGKVKIQIWQEKDLTWISISDNGIGIDDEDLQNLGKKFFRAKQYIPNNESGSKTNLIIRPGGTGLGLYVTFDLIRVMGGNLYITSKPEQGSTFTFSIPSYTGQQEKQIDQAFDTNPVERRKHVFINQEAPSKPPTLA